MTLMGGLNSSCLSSFYYQILLMMQKKERNEAQEERGLEERNSSDWECSEPSEQDEGLVSQQKIDDLHSSLDRLRLFVGSLPEETISSVPTCVAEYYDKMEEYKLDRRDQVVLLAQRRLTKMLRNKKIKRNWNNDDICLLVWVVSQRLRMQGYNHFSEFAKEDWEFISSLISGSTWQKCKFRWLSLKKVKLVTNKWSKAQSKLLSEVIAQNPKIHWKSIAEKLYQHNSAKNKVFRTAKQCREHWNCFLNPNIQKGPWTIQQDRKLLEYVQQLEGSKKWSEISKFMEGRTENALKNRFNLLMNRQKKLSNINATEKRLVKACLNRLILEEGQQQQLGSAPPIPFEAAQESEVEQERQLPPTRQAPIVPTVVETSQNNSQQFSFGDPYNGFYNYMPSNMGLGSGNSVYIGFVFPNQFL